MTFLLAILILTGCTSKGHITVVNSSQSPLANVVVEGTGFKSTIGPIAAGATQRITITPRPDDKAGLKLDFDSDGKHFTSNRSAGVWNGMKEVILTVEPSFSIKEATITTF